ncbi:MAG: hypothetical protein OEZ16_10620 [Chromatiales bacterium]|nr:hypothetical protein [Chromatiales bacterium]
MPHFKLIVASTLMALVSASALAEYRTPAEIALPIKSDYRTSDVVAKEGTHFIWVERIEGRDSQGNMHLLFDDFHGALLPVEHLSRADRLINPQQVSQRGHYDSLRLHLGAKMLVVSANGMKHIPLTKEYGRSVELKGGIDVSKFEVSSNGLNLQKEQLERLALLTQ